MIFSERYLSGMPSQKKNYCRCSVRDSVSLCRVFVPQPPGTRAAPASITLNDPVVASGSLPGIFSHVPRNSGKTQAIRNLEKSQKYYDNIIYISEYRITCRSEKRAIISKSLSAVMI